MDLDAKSKEYTEMKKNNAYLCKLATISNENPKNLMPKFISAANSVTQINTFCPDPPEIWETSSRQVDLLKTTSKIKIISGGDWDFGVVATKKYNFQHRQEFDDVVLQRTWCCFGQIIPQTWETITIPEAFKQVGVTLCLNFENILESASDEAKEKFEVQGWILGKKAREEKVLKSFLLQIFGQPKNQSLGQQVEFTNFKRYYEGGNSCYGTADYGENYVFMRYATS